MVLVHITRYVGSNVQDARFVHHPYPDQNQYILDSCAMCVPAQNNPNWDGSHHICKVFHSPVLNALAGNGPSLRRQIALKSDIGYVRGEYDLHRQDHIDKIKTRLHSNFAYHLT